jgi:hypothetical protein
MALTTEIMLLIGLAFPVLIILLLRDKQIVSSNSRIFTCTQKIMGTYVGDIDIEILISDC